MDHAVMREERNKCVITESECFPINKTSENEDRGEEKYQDSSHWSPDQLELEDEPKMWLKPVLRANLLYKLCFVFVGV